MFVVREKKSWVEVGHSVNHVVSGRVVEFETREEANGLWKMLNHTRFELVEVK